ncbi:hypothetical protein AQI88_00260 [Streptomyces cellostaticus]|uniref:DUF3455 domain-containing protein n=1 Tax=Streptomyces cellostaticus TaxID=67285 RepID=A0A101NTI3_9ACTN|nr:DUF3455 domain-containing protein [Streptomyces cellostaticus]KUM99040.1 hypothetical protein AQI88_00260 [Streptomyces cellostaticus]GHI03492.1 hypothetical protein Scel_18130 [Streptomyces cellostaticus]
MTRKRTPSRSKKIAALVLGIGALSGAIALTTGAGFASQTGSPGAVTTADTGTPGSFRAPVRHGVQIYGCTRQPDGTFAFTQHDVRAALKGGIKHSFVSPDAGPPQWIAPDGSAVTGKIISRTPNGQGNIPELELTATQSGRPTGKLATVTTVRRLDTRGGVAPTGSCDPATQPTVKVPYSAVYEFVSAPGHASSSTPTPPGN